MSDPPAPDRRSLAIACLAASGIVLPYSGSLGWLLAVIGVALLAALAFGWRERTSRSLHPRTQALALALLLALLLRSLARLLVSVPTLVPGLALVLLVLVLLARRASGVGLVLLALVAGTGLGGVLEREGPTPRGRAVSSPLLGVHPRQAVAVTIDGYGPHDLIADDFVEPSGAQGHDPRRWAARLESELHRVAALHYAEGPARAREAFAAAEVVVVAPALAPEDAAKLGIPSGVEVRSGTTGEGSSVAFGCPGALLGPARAAAPRTSECPHKYARDGSTGLGLSPRWAGYTELRGRDRLRLARVLGWPSGVPEHDTRRLAIELALLAFASFAAIAWLARSPAGPSLDPLALLAALLVVGLALLDASPPGHAGVVALSEALHAPLVLELGASWSLARSGAGIVVVLALLPGTIACARELALADRPSHPWLLTLVLLLALGLRKPGDDPALLACAVALLLATSLEGPPTRSRVAAIALALAAALPLLDPGWLHGPSGPGSRDFVGLAAIGALSLLTLVAGWSSAHRPVER